MDLSTKQLSIVYWENLSTNLTQHERFLGFSRKSSCQSSIPPCLPIRTPVFVKRHTQGSKSDNKREHLIILQNNQFSADDQYQSGHRGRVSITDVALTGSLGSKANNWATYRVRRPPPYLNPYYQWG
ncbi:hypothetical protein GJ496_000032 [Pomphorhynchus laevis]|nr:hypothetical protein GJ496_000032 [Pomphorhynchus laevis]